MVLYFNEIWIFYFIKQNAQTKTWIVDYQILTKNIKKTIQVFATLIKTYDNEKFVRYPHRNNGFNGITQDLDL